MILRLFLDFFCLPWYPLGEGTPAASGGLTPGSNGVLPVHASLSGCARPAPAALRRASAAICGTDRRVTRVSDEDVNRPSTGPHPAGHPSELVGAYAAIFTARAFTASDAARLSAAAFTALSRAQRMSAAPSTRELTLLVSR